MGAAGRDCGVSRGPGKLSGPHSRSLGKPPNGLIRESHKSTCILKRVYWPQEPVLMSRGGANDLPIS